MSTAALMHDVETGIPEGAEPSLEDGYFVTCLSLGQRWVFGLYHEDAPHSRISYVEVHEPRKSWGYVGNQIQPASATLVGQSNYAKPELQRATADLLAMTSYFVEALNDGIAAQIAAAEEEERKSRERRRLEHEQRVKERAEAERLREEKVAEIFEAVKWHIGDKFRLKRNDRYGAPMRATVFGTIDSVQPLAMYTTSEKGKAMRIMLSTITKLEIRDDENPRKFDLIYEAPARAEA